MKFRYIAFSALALSFLASSCSRYDELEAPLETEWIRFSTESGIVGTGEMETKAMENEITCDITDWDYDEDSTATKAGLVESVYDSVGVFGYNYSTWSSSVTPNVMYNLKNTLNGESLTPVSKVLWKNATADSLRFYAYAPYNVGTVSESTVGGNPYLNYTVSTDVSKQMDILYAQSDTVHKSHRTAVPLQFKHAMTAVQFRLGIDGATLNSVTLTKIKNSGRLSLDGTWSNLSGSATFTISDPSSILMMIPQTLATGATVTLNYTPQGGSATNISASIAGQVWDAGKKVVYTLKKKKTDDTDEYIYLDLGLGNVNLTAGGYSGYVSVNGTRTKVEGTHNDNNKYYIYQSIYDQAPTTDHNVDDVRYTVTGYASEADFNAKKNCRVPQYKSDIMYYSPTKKGVTCPDWGKFITNNQSPYDVRAMWDNGDQNYSTKNTISICGPESGSSVFDVTLDRVFSSYYPYKYKEDGKWKISDKKGSLSIGHDGNSFKNNFTEKVTLRLKNNNALSRIHYRKPLDCTKDGYLKITSADGDGIAKGTLIVTANKIAESTETKDVAQIVVSLIGAATDIGTDYNDWRGKTDRQVKDLYFNGGIVYVGTQKYANSFWDNNNPLLCNIGGVNSYSEVTINGGILTSVSNNTCAAIGSGGGWESAGGKGVVTINGGTVYAYSFGVLGTFNDTTTVVIPPAIGGGGTLGAYVEGGKYYAANAGPCEVNINGGNVYAYAVGGPAIGGGSCGRHAAGYCEFTMEGGKVVAQSLAGKIGGKDVSATNAIGGGRSGLVNGDGGTAKLTLKGGYLQTGSVGGGTVDERNPTGKIGSADITIKGGETNAQFIMAKGAGTAPIFKMEGGVIKNSTTTGGEFAKVQLNGGAVYMEEGTCSIENGTISNCSGNLGGAVYMNGGTFTLSGGKISDCKGNKDGGAVYVEGGDVTVSGGEIYHNLASKGNGGGVYITGGNFTMTGGKINNNAADADPDKGGGTTFYGGNGGGIFVTATDTDPEVNLTGGEITYNAADRNGGGLFVTLPDSSSHRATITIGEKVVADRDTLSPNIRMNSAALSGGGMAVQGKGSNITIYSGTVKGNVSAYVKNEDIRNDGGTVDLVGKNEEGKDPQVNVQYNTIKFYANNGVDPEPYDEQRVITSTNSPLRPTEKAMKFELEFYHIGSWNTKRDGTGTKYNADGSGAVMNITSDVNLYAQWVYNQK